MKHMIYAMIAALVLITAPAASAAQASAQAQSDIRVMPDSGLYGIKLAFEQVRTTFAFGAESKAQANLNYADKRVTEMQAMIEANNTQAAMRAANRYETNVNAAANAAARINNDGSQERARTGLEQSSSVRANLQTSIAHTAQVHAEILERQSERMSAQQHAQVQSAFETALQAGLNADTRIEDKRLESKQRYQVLANLSEQEANVAEANISSQTGLQAQLDARQNALAGLSVALQASSQANTQAQSTLVAVVDEFNTSGSTQIGARVGSVAVTSSQNQQEESSETSAQTDASVTTQSGTVNTSAQARTGVRVTS